MPKTKLKMKPCAVQRVVTPAAPMWLPDIDDFPPWRSLNQTCAYLQIALPRAYRMLRQGELMSYTVGGRRRIPSSEIKALMGLAERVQLKRKIEPFEPLRDVPNRWANPNTLKTTSRPAGAA